MTDPSDTDTTQPPTKEPPLTGPRRLRRSLRRQPEEPDGDLVDEYDDEDLSSRVWSY
jgi:hypothetical protein